MIDKDNEINRSENTNIETEYIRDEIAKCEDTEELKEKILPLLKSQRDRWSVKIVEMIRESGLTKADFAENCGVSRMTVNKWCNGSIPKNRETFLRIGMTAGYRREQMDRLLQRYGRYPALYSKSLEDCVCIFVLEHGYEKETLTKYDYILNKIKANIIRNDDPENSDISTEDFDEKLSDVRDEDELERFICENSSTFSTAYHKLYAYIKMHIEAAYGIFDGSVFELAEGQGWSSSLRQCVSAIRQSKWYPTRNKIISLGLHLSLDHEQIDEMLSLAHMEPLCGKNIFESVIMFILDDASLNDMLDSGSDDYDPDELCRYALEIFREMDLPELEPFISELPETDDEW